MDAANTLDNIAIALLASIQVFAFAVVAQLES